MRRNTQIHHSNPIMPRLAEAEDAVEDVVAGREEGEAVNPVTLLNHRDIEQHY